MVGVSVVVRLWNWVLIVGSVIVRVIVRSSGVVIC